MTDSIRITIPLTQGKVAYCSPEDAARLSLHKWCIKPVHDTFHAVTTHNGKKLTMHVVIMRPPDGMDVAHRDDNGLNNVRGNLVTCTTSQAHQRQRKAGGCSSIFKGVTWHARTGKWQARIRVDDKNLWLGSFAHEADAGRKYNEAAIKHFGEFARLNVID